MYFTSDTGIKQFNRNKRPSCLQSKNPSAYHQSSSKAVKDTSKALTTIFEDSQIQLPSQIKDSPTKTEESYSVKTILSPQNTNFLNRCRENPLIKVASPASLLLLRTGSLSPKIFLSSKKLDENLYSKQKYHLPVPGSQALVLFKDMLTEYEKQEIVNYEQVYYFGPRIKKIRDDFCDTHGVYRAVIGDHLGYRYEIIELLGKGTFGHVYKCFDHKRESLVAVKILRKNPKIRKQGENEIKNLEILNKEDHDDNKCLVKMLQCFEFRGHLCISFELLSTNLYQFLKKSHFHGVNLSLIRRIALQVLIALRHLHSLGLVHSDLKLENILLKSECKTSIKVIDFGSTTNHVNPLYSYLQSRYYRAPEVILGCGYDNKIDIWSLGCILVELFTGRPLFPGDNEADQLIRIMAAKGEPPRGMLEKSIRRTLFFNQDFTPILRKNKKGVLMLPEVREIVKTSNSDENEFRDFIKKTLEWDVKERISADDALKHPWIKGYSVNDAHSEQKYRRLLFV